MFELNGKTVVITGAASGIGRALALEASRRGARLALADLDEKGLEETAGMLGPSKAGNRLAGALDVSDRAAVRSFAARVRDELGGVDVLINNAGVSSSGRVCELRYETLEWTLNVNLWGTINMTKEFLPSLLERPEAALVNISSVFGLMGVPGQAAYCASKFGVRGFTESLRLEMSEGNVAVTLVLPGGVRTNIVRNSRSDFQVDEETIRRGNEEFEGGLGTSPEKAAAAIIEGVRRKRARVLIGGDARFLDYLVRLMPVGYGRLIMSGVRKSPVWRALHS